MLRPLRKAPVAPAAPIWMVTFADLMSLMLTFFILLVSFSEFQRGKVEEVLKSIHGALGLSEGTVPFSLGAQPVTGPPTPEVIERIARQLQERLLERGKDRDVQLEIDEQGGLRINLPSRILFDSARADLKPDPETRRVLSDVAEVLAEIREGFFEVRGHTDNRPLLDTSVYSDNYDLSFARAMAVARYVNAVARIPLDQFEIVACGPGQPAATNGTPEGQAANRRVEIYVRGELTPRELGETRRRMGTMNGLPAAGQR